MLNKIKTTAASKEINNLRRPTMTVKALIKKLQEYNLNAEVLVLENPQTGDTQLATIIREVDNNPKYFGFTSATVEKPVSKKKHKRVVIA